MVILVSLIIISVVAISYFYATNFKTPKGFPYYNAKISIGIVHADCSFIKNQANPKFDYCESYFAPNHKTYFCKCCWDRSDQYNFTLCQFYEVRKVGNRTELWQAYPATIVSENLKPNQFNITIGFPISHSKHQ